MAIESLARPGIVPTPARFDRDGCSHRHSGIRRVTRRLLLAAAPLLAALGTLPAIAAAADAPSAAAPAAPIVRPGDPAVDGTIIGPFHNKW